MLMRKFKNVVATGMLVTMTATMVLPGIAAADNKSGNEKQKPKKVEVRLNLGDVNNHWANKNIRRLSSEGVINGYADGMFKPEKKVTKMEAVVMAVRLMGLNPEENTGDITLPYKDAATIPAWGRGYVDLALDKGIIEPGNVFQPNKPATRLEVTTILIRTLGMKVDSQASEAELKFTDLQNISPELKEYIALAVLNNLLTGYEDGTFRPNVPVTRAELATLFARAQENSYIGQTSFAKGIVLALDQSKIKVQTEVYSEVYGNTREFTVISGAAIFRNNKVATLSDLKVQDKVEIVLNSNSEAVFIDAKETVTTELLKQIKGRVTTVDSTTSTISVLVSGIVEAKYVVASDAVVQRDGKSATLGEIQANDKVQMQRNDQGIITKIIAESKVAPPIPKQKDKKAEKANEKDR